MTNIDLLVMPNGFTDGLSHHDLYSDTWVCLVSADNPDVADELTIEHLRTMPWVASYHGPTAATPASRQMRMLGIEPHVQVVTETASLEVFSPPFPETASRLPWIHTLLGTAPAESPGSAGARRK